MSLSSDVAEVKNDVRPFLGEKEKKLRRAKREKSCKEEIEEWPCVCVGGEKGETKEQVDGKKKTGNGWVIASGS